MVDPLKIPLHQFSIFRQTENLWHRPVRIVAFEPGDGPWAEDDHPVSRFTAERFLPGVGDHVEFFPGQRHGEYRRGRIADGQAGTVRGNPISVRDTDSRSGSVPHEDDVPLRVGRLQIGQLTVVRLQNPCVLQAQLAGDVRRPSAGKTVPDQNVHRSRTQKGPQGHFQGPGVRSGHDAQQVIVGQTEKFAALGNGFGQPGLAFGRSVGPAQDRRRKGLRRPSRPLGARARGKVRAGRTHSRFHHEIPLGPGTIWRTSHCSHRAGWRGWKRPFPIRFLPGPRPRSWFRPACRPTGRRRWPRCRPPHRRP